jgi:Leucine-rich repeat (LRR) protein
MEDLPPGLQLLTSLTALDISYNRLRSIPVWISQLTTLQHINLARNHLTSLPGELTQLSLLTQLQLQGNNLAGLPLCLGQLTSLRLLNVGMNYKLKEVCMGQLVRLPRLRDVVLPYRLTEVAAELRAVGKCVLLE